MYNAGTDILDGDPLGRLKVLCFGLVVRILTGTLLYCYIAVD